MGLFSRGKPAAPPLPGYTVLATGRRLASGKGVAECLDTLASVLGTYRPERRGLPSVLPANCRWDSKSGPEPAALVSCSDNRDDFLLVVFTKTSSGTDIGLFPLGHGEERLNLPIIGHWKQRDTSLSSTGIYPARSAMVGAPVVPDDLAESTIALAGRPLTRKNIDAVHRSIFELHLIKASEFVESRDGHARSLQFIAQMKQKAINLPPAKQAQSVLEDLAAWETNVIPYLNDLPWRCRAIILETATAATDGRPDMFPDI